MGTLQGFFLRSTLLVAALGTLPPGAAAAELYKWVDEKGVVTYSNTPPTTRQPKKVEAVPERVTVYTPDATLNRAMAQQDAKREASIASLERELEAEKRARARAEQQAGRADRDAQRRAAAYERCVADRGVDCDAVKAGTPGGYIADPATSGYLPYVVVGAHVPPKPFAIIGPTRTPVPGISTAPPVGISTAPPVGISTAPPVGAQPPRNIRTNPPRDTR